MNTIQLFRLAKTTAINIARYHRFRAPAVARINVTESCNLRCSYCGFGDKPSGSIPLDVFCRIIDTLSSLGTYAVSLSGGEPLIHPEIDQIIDYIASKKSIRIHLNTNGILIKKKSYLLKHVNQVRLSFDGLPANHDAIRGEGSYQAVENAIAVLQRQKCNFFLNTTLNKLNANDLEYVLHFCKQNSTRSFFQPASLSLLADSSIPNKHALDQTTHQDLITQLIQFKKDKKYKHQIDNSMKSLHYIRNWPRPTKIPCFAGSFFFQITDARTIDACPRTRTSQSVLANNIWDKPTFLSAFNQLTPPNCHQCWCNLADINYLMAKIIPTFRQ